MQDLLRSLELIETEHKEFFEKRNIKLYQYVSISKTPVMLRFNKDMDSAIKLPEEIYNKVRTLIANYYGLDKF